MENTMYKFLSAALIVLLFLVPTNSQAKEFEWLDNLNVQALADSSGFRVRLATRFHIDDVEIRAVLNQVNNASDAYMVLRLGELSHRPLNDVIHSYNNNKHKGWGRLAKDLGIKPGSKEFKALKNGHDLDGGKSKKSQKKSQKNKGKNKNKGKK